MLIEFAYVWIHSAYIFFFCTLYRMMKPTVWMGINTIHMQKSNAKVIHKIMVPQKEPLTISFFLLELCNFVICTNLRLLWFHGSSAAPHSGCGNHLNIAYVVFVYNSVYTVKWARADVVWCIVTWQRSQREVTHTHCKIAFTEIYGYTQAQFFLIHILGVFFFNFPLILLTLYSAFIVCWIFFGPFSFAFALWVLLLYYIYALHCSTLICELNFKTNLHKETYICILF